MSTHIIDYRTRPAPEAATLRVALRPSLWLGIALGAGHAAALAIAAAMLPAGAASCAVIAVGLSWLDAQRRHVARTAADAIVGLQLSTSGGMVVHQRSGRYQAGRLVSRFVSPALVVVTLRLPRGWRTIPVVILPDAVGTEEHRRLRVWLKWSRLAPITPVQT
jgi:toxin CptA